MTGRGGRHPTAAMANRPPDAREGGGRTEGRADDRGCECGSPKPPGATACRACTWLDGSTPSEARLISVLRALGGAAPLAALFLETGLSRSHLFWSLARLRRAT